MQSTFTLNAVIVQSADVLELQSVKDQMLLGEGNARPGLNQHLQ